jgi:hypothetical protein
MNKKWICFLAILIALITMAPGTQPPKTPPATQPVKTQPVETEPIKTQPVETVPVETEPVITEEVTAEPQRTPTANRDQKDKLANASLPRSGYGPQRPAASPASALFGVLATAVLLAIAGALLAVVVGLWNRK